MSRLKLRFSTDPRLPGDDLPRSPMLITIDPVLTTDGDNRTATLLRWRRGTDPLHWTLEIDAIPAQPRPAVVAVCGASRFLTELLEAQEELSRQGHVVLHTPRRTPIAWSELNATEQQQARQHYLRRLEFVDLLYVVNVTGYVGDDTRLEIEQANRYGIAVRYLTIMPN